MAASRWCYLAGPRSRLGRIINISTADAVCFPSEISYGASKLALEGYTRSAALELGQFGITANVLSLGSGPDRLDHTRVGEGDSPYDHAWRGRPDRKTWRMWSFSGQARWVTGQKIYAGGGHGM